MGLGAELESLASEIVAGRAARVGGAAARRQGVDQQLAGLRTYRATVIKAMLIELTDDAQERRQAVRAALAVAREQRMADGAARRQALRNECVQRAEEVHSGLNQWNDKRQQAEAQWLSALQQERLAEARALRDQLASQRQALGKAMQDEIGALRADRARGRAAWARATVGATGSATTVRPAAVPVVARAATAAAPAAVVEVRAAEIQLRQRIVAFVNAHPDGVKLTDLETALGVPRIRVGNLIRGLVNEGMVRKEDLLYLPTLGGR